MKDIRGREIAIGDRIRRAPERSEEHLKGGIMDPRETERVTAFTLGGCVVTLRSVYRPELIECVGPTESWPEPEAT